MMSGYVEQRREQGIRRGTHFLMNAQTKTKKNRLSTYRTKHSAKWAFEILSSLIPTTSSTHLLC